MGSINASLRSQIDILDTDLNLENRFTNITRAVSVA